MQEDGGESSALECYERMRSEAVCPDRIGLVHFLGACGTLGALRKGRQAHAAAHYVGLSRLHGDLSIGSSLAALYANCGCMDEAEAVFGAFSSHDAPFYNVLISGFARHGHSEKSIAYFDQMMTMRLEGILPDAGSFVACLRASASLRNVQKGREIHAAIESRGWSSEELSQSLIRMYAEGGSSVEAWQVLGKLRMRGADAWRAMIVGLVESGGRFDEEAVMCMEQMQVEGVSPDSVTLAAALKARNRVRGAENGVLAAASCEDVVVWNTLIAGDAESGDGGQALRRVAEMRHLHGISPTIATYVSALKSCTAIGALDMGQELHSEIEIRGLLLVREEEEVVVLGNALLHMYAKCGSIEEARQMLDGRRLRAPPNVAACNSLLAGYGQLGELASMAELLRHLPRPDSVTFLILLSACGHVGLAEEAELCYKQLLTPGIEHRNCLLHALGRAGQLHDAAALAARTPRNHPDDDPVLLRTLMGACLHSGHVELARAAFFRSEPR
jgi:pentatricopeptide repeat protein